MWPDLANHRCKTFLSFFILVTFLYVLNLYLFLNVFIISIIVIIIINEQETRHIQNVLLHSQTINVFITFKRFVYIFLQRFTCVW